MLSNAIIAAVSLQRCCSLVCVRNESGRHPALLLLRHQQHIHDSRRHVLYIESNSRSAAGLVHTSKLCVNSEMTLGYYYRRTK
jgi:hypothetical protein